MNLLFVAAWEPELERFRAFVRTAEPAAHGRAAAIGVGLVEASVGLARLLGGAASAPTSPAGVVLLGTCGALPGSGLSPGDVVVAARARLVEPAVLGGRAALPPPMPADAEATPWLVARAASAGARAVTAVNTPAITVDDALASELAAQGDVEHLEVFAVARACAAFALPWCAVLGVANPFGAAGRDAWRRHHLDASARAADLAASALLTIRT